MGAIIKIDSELYNKLHIENPERFPKFRVLVYDFIRRGANKVSLLEDELCGYISLYVKEKKPFCLMQRTSEFSHFLFGVLCDLQNTKYISIDQLGNIKILK